MVPLWMEWYAATSDSSTYDIDALRSGHIAMTLVMLELRLTRPSMGNPMQRPSTVMQ
jgi:hypothetical protein